ncbi:MAG: hypothetical protein LBT40_12595 [Deltaproteobacteria bacterium]|nr:hypothetical protein [Deltaproteobacteria bacterium]
MHFLSAVPHSLIPPVSSGKPARAGGPVARPPNAWGGTVPARPMISPSGGTVAVVRPVISTAENTATVTGPVFSTAWSAAAVAGAMISTAWSAAAVAGPMISATGGAAAVTGPAISATGGAAAVTGPAISATGGAAAVTGPAIPSAMASAFLAGPVPAPPGRAIVMALAIIPPALASFGTSAGASAASRPLIPARPVPVRASGRAPAALIGDLATAFLGPALRPAPDTPVHGHGPHLAAPRSSLSRLRHGSSGGRRTSSYASCPLAGGIPRLRQASTWGRRAASYASCPLAGGIARVRRPFPATVLGPGIRNEHREGRESRGTEQGHGTGRAERRGCHADLLRAGGADRPVPGRSRGF